MGTKKIRKPQHQKKSREISLLFVNTGDNIQDQILNFIKEFWERYQNQNIKLNVILKSSLQTDKYEFLKENNITLSTFEKFRTNPNSITEDSNEYLLINCQDLYNYSNFRELIIKYNESIKYEGVSIYKSNKQVHAIAITANVFDYLYKLDNSIEIDFYRFFFHAQKIDLPIKKIELNSGESKEKSKNNNLLKKIKLNYEWFFKIPLQEIKTKPHKNYSFIRENSIYRFLFIDLAVLFAILLPLMSLHTGISGDEDRHVEQAENVYKYFETNGEDDSYMDTKYGPFYAYNITFDVALYIISKTFNIENIYDFRHVINAIFGFLAILFSGLLAVKIKGWRAGILTMVILFISPRFLGHSYNNPKDIPYALGYVMGIYFLIRFLKELPELKISTGILLTLSIGYVLNTRIGGLLIIVYIYFFTAIFVLHATKIKKWFSSENLKYYLRIFIFLTVCSFVGYVIGIIFWPYALEAPVTNVKKSLEIMTHHSVGIRQVFEGKFIWSDNVPWYYSIKYMLITIPLVVFVGLLLAVVFFKKLIREINPVILSLILFSFIFPIFYIIYKESNVYGGWRHLIFVYLFIVIFASLGFNALFEKVKKSNRHYILFLLIAILSIHPIKHIIKNHPLQYIYFNEIYGGVNKAFGNYEIDYYYHSIRQASDWLIEKLEKDGSMKTDSSILIATNFTPGVKYQFRKYKNIKPFYVRYYERGNSDWDYAIIATSYINADQIKVKSWPPDNTIHTIDVDDIPASIILKRKSKLDYIGYQKLKNRDFPGAINDLNGAIKQEKTNEVAYINLATAYMYIRQFDQAENTVRKLLEIYPKYDKGLNLLGLVYYNQRNYEEAYKTFTSITETNPKFVSAYHNLGLVFLRMNKKNDALKYFQQAIKTNNKYKPPYLAIAQILKEAGKNEEAQKYIDAAKKLK